MQDCRRDKRDEGRRKEVKKREKTGNKKWNPILTLPLPAAGALPLMLLL